VLSQEEDATKHNDRQPNSLVTTKEEALVLLKSNGVYNDVGVTLTLIGYKGGQMADQINQDRSFVLSPFRLSWIDEAESQIMGVSSAHRFEFRSVLFATLFLILILHLSSFR
jgi:hypothetical protein